MLFDMIQTQVRHKNKKTTVSLMCSGGGRGKSPSSAMRISNKTVFCAKCICIYKCACL